MRTKNVTSIALLFMLMLLGQAMTGHLYQYPGMDGDASLESENIVMASNSTDTDGDGVYDADDACPNGNTGWTSSSATDYDADGCQDSSEDTDDDNDGLSDVNDDCAVGNLGWTSSSVTDYDSDGCQDSTEDVDDDNDGVIDADDSCPKGDLGWISSSSTDADSDGCRDSTEDFDTLSWSTPVSLDSTGWVGLDTSLAIDSNDHLHVTYQDNSNANLAYVTYDGSSWSTPITLDNRNIVGQESSLAIDSNDNLHVTYYADYPSYSLEYMTYDGSSWSTPVSLDSTDNVGRESSLAIDSNDNLHVTYRDGTNANLEYMTYDGSSWSTPVTLDSTDNVGWQSSLAIDSNDHLHVTYYDYTNGNLEYMTHNGSSWTTPVCLESTDNVGWDSSLAIDSSDNLHVTYFDTSNGNLEYMTHDGSSWSSSVSLDSTDEVGWVSSLAIDSNDHLHVTYYDNTSKNLEYMTHDGSSWSTPVSLDSTDNVGYDSSLAIDSNDNLHVTYHDNTNGNLEYMTSSNSSGGNGTANNTECLIFTNFNFDYNYSAAPQDSFNLTANLTNTCAESVLYPNTVVVFEQQGINITHSSHWRYEINGENSSYSVSWQVSRDSTFGEGEMVIFEIHPSRDNCYENCTESQNYNYTVEIPFGLFDLNSCYTIGNITDDYSADMTSFNLSADLITDCSMGYGGLLHYPWADLEGDFINGTYVGYGASFYAMGLNDSNPVQWSIAVPSNLTNGTVMTYSLAPTCAWVTMSLLWPSVNNYNSYNQNCDDVGFDEMYHSVVVINSNFDDENNTGGTNISESSVSIDWIYVNSSMSGVHDAQFSVEHNGTWTAYWGITNPNTAPTFPTWNSTTGWWDASASGDIGTTSGNGDTTWMFNDMEQWGALAPPSCHILMIALFEGELGSASSQMTPAQGLPLSSDFQTFVIGNLTDADCQWDESWGSEAPSENNTGNNTDDNTGNNTGDNTGNNTDDNTGNNTGDNTGNNTDDNTGNNTGDDVDNQDDSVEIFDCVFGDINYAEGAEVIFYVSWVDASNVQHCGTIQFEMYSNSAPIHSQNFRDHVEAGNYDGVGFHRVIDDFMIQGGDIEFGNGMGGYAYSWQGYCRGQMIDQADCLLNDYSIPDEFDTSLVHQKGALSMAHSGPNTGGSQFFIMDRNDATWLDGVHSVFGQAIAGTIDGVEVTGIEVVDAMSLVEVEGPSASSPVHDVTILSAENIGTPQSNENPTLPDEEVPQISSIGVIGTAVAISAGFFISIRREDEE